MRKILIFLGVLLLAIVGVAVYFVTNLDYVVKSRIERVGTRIAGVPVSVDSVSISIAEGTATVRGLAVANPEGFGPEPAFHFDEISTTVAYTDAAIKRVYTRNPTIRVTGALGSTNIDKIRSELKKSAATSPSAEEEASAAATVDEMSANESQGQDSTATDNAVDDLEDDKNAAVMTIERIRIEQANVILNITDIGETVNLSLDELEFNDLKGNRSEITAQILNQLTAKVMRAVKKELRKRALSEAKSELLKQGDKLQKKLKDKLKGLLE